MSLDINILREKSASRLAIVQAEEAQKEAQKEALQIKEAEQILEQIFAKCLESANEGEFVCRRAYVLRKDDYSRYFKYAKQLNDNTSWRSYRFQHIVRTLTEKGFSYNFSRDETYTHDYPTFCLNVYWRPPEPVVEKPVGFWRRLLNRIR